MSELSRKPFFSDEDRSAVPRRTVITPEEYMRRGRALTPENVRDLQTGIYTSEEAAYAALVKILRPETSVTPKPETGN